jgi:CBS domain-containing protein
MDLETHCKNTARELGQSYIEIHLWLDEFARAYSQTFYGYETTTFEHRKFRHHREGIDEAVIKFKSKYPEDIVKKVCENHLKDDYGGYVPVKEDFYNPEFIRKHHK